jgi:branched-chain amino acid transport system permease protein
MLLTTIALGLVLGGTYALIALGLTLQYGISRIMNLAYGEVIIAASFAAFVLFSGLGLNPLLAMLIVVPAGFGISWVIYAVMMRPLVARSGGGRLEIDSILATFGLLFVIQGTMLIVFGGNFTGYNFLNAPVEFLGITLAANRLIAFGLALTLGLTLYLLMTRTRWGAAMRAVAFRPHFAPLVGIDVNRAVAFAFALGGALAASGGVVVSMYQTFTATSGVIFTMKALIVVIMGGVGNLLGAVCAGLLLGLVETLVSAYIDPGLTLAAIYAIFLTVILVRPQGLFGKRTG